MNRKILYLKVIFFFGSIFLIGFSINENFEKISPLFSLKIYDFLTLVLLILIFLNLISLRNFILIKKKIGNVLNFNKWSYIFFYTLIINEFLFMSGHVFRSFELKKYSFTHRKYIALQIFLKLLDITLNLIILTLIIIFFFKTNFLLIFFFLILIILFYFFVTLKINYLIKKYLILVQKFLKIKSINHILDVIDYINNFIERKNILSLSVITIFIIFIKFFIFQILFIHFVGNETNPVIFGYFAVYYLLRHIPFFNNIPGFIEIIYAFFMQLTGYSFFELLLFQIFLRFLGWVGMIINLASFYTIQEYFLKPKKNNDI